MIIEVKTVKTERTSPHACKTKRVIIYQCDQCGKIFDGKYQKEYLTNRQYHFCGYECMGTSRSLGGVACEYQLSCRDMQVWQQNVQDTLLKRYGVTNPSSLDWVKFKKVQTTRLHYGVDNPQQDPGIKLQSLITHASHGRNWMSKPEKKFRQLLENFFGKDEVKVQCLLERKWSIDFYVKNIDTYVQFDGVYWHGLDRPIEIIQASNGKRDQAIYKKWIKDRELDVYCVENGLRLVRVTDKEHKLDPDACLLKVAGIDVPTFYRSP